MISSKPHTMHNSNLLENEWCQISHIPKLNIITADWTGYLKLEQVIESCSMMSKIIKENKIKLHYSNQSNLKVLSKAVQKYLIEEWYPEIERLGLERIAVLNATDLFARASASKVNDTVMELEKLNVFSFALEKEYHYWLKLNHSIVSKTEQLAAKISAYHKLDLAEDVKKLDPLGFDDELKLIAQYNANAKVKKLIKLLYRKLPEPKKVEGFDYYNAIASMRDIGILLGSIKRHGHEPIEEIPELEYVLEVLSKKTNLPPRDILLHYTVWNPEGSRMRLYTSYSDEIGLVESVRKAFPSLEKALYQLIKLHDISMENPYFEEHCKKASTHFKEVIKSIVLAKKMVAPEIFAKELRFYFDPIIYNSQELIGPGAVEMPMFLYDHVLWSSQITNTEYVDFKTKYIPYNLSFVRDIYEFFKGKDSLVDIAIQNLSLEPSNQVIKSAKALLMLCNIQKSFRKPHQKLADEAYERQEKNGKTKGSGGYSTEILTFIQDLNNKKIEALKNAIDKQVPKEHTPSLSI